MAGGYPYTYGNEAKTLLEDLQGRNERMFLVTMLVMNTAKKRQKLENDVFAASGVAQKYNCALKRLDYQQEQGLMSLLPLGLNQIEIKRSLTTSSVAIFVPICLKGARCTLSRISSGYAICGTDGRTPGRKKDIPTQEQFSLSHDVYKCEEKYFEEIFKICSDLPPVFLLCIEGCNLNTIARGYVKPTRKGGLIRYHRSLSNRIRVYQPTSKQINQNQIVERSQHHESHYQKCG